jgi:hypothetical protein
VIAFILCCNFNFQEIGKLVLSETKRGKKVLAKFSLLFFISAAVGEVDRNI